MYCPNCKEYSKCGCKSCKDRDNGGNIETWKFDKEKDLIQCPKCFEWSHPDEILEYEYEVYFKNNNQEALEKN